MASRIVVILVALVSVATAADLPSKTVTGRRNDEQHTYTHEDGRADTALGLSIAVFSTARIEFAVTRDRWEAAAKRDHVRVAFAEPVTLRANTSGVQGKSYAVDEILIDTTPFAKRPPLPTQKGQGYIAAGDKVDLSLGAGLLIRSGDKYFAFIKYEGILADPLITMFGPRDGSER